MYTSSPATRDRHCIALDLRVSTRKAESRGKERLRSQSRPPATRRLFYSTEAVHKRTAHSFPVARILKRRLGREGDRPPCGTAKRTLFQRIWPQIQRAENMVIALGRNVPTQRLENIRDCELIRMDANACRSVRDCVSRWCSTGDGLPRQNNLWGI